MSVEGEPICGIVGAVGRIWSKEETAFKYLLQLDTIRGHHSTGVFSAKKTGAYNYVKQVGTPYELIPTKGWTDFIAGCHSMLFGHNRMATRGEVTNDNAHPFAHKHIVGCHNGTLSSFHNLKDAKDFKVDSDALFNNVAEEGIHETIKKLNGAFALCWYDQNEHSINLVRNKERPLYTCMTKDDKTMFWASEPWMIHIALARAEIERGEIVPLEVGKLLKIEVPTVGGNEVKGVVSTQEDVEFYVAPTFHYPRYERNNWWEAQQARQAVSKAAQNTQTGTTGVDSPERGHQSVIPFHQATHTSQPQLARRFLGKEVVFSVVGPRKKGNLDFILCDIEDEINPPELRVFISQGIEAHVALKSLLMTTPCMLKAKVKDCTVYGAEAYVTVDVRTIVEMPFDVEDGNQEVVNDDVSDDDEEILNQSMQDYADSLKNCKYTGFEGRLLTAEQYANLTQDGCGMCASFPNLNGRHKLEWANPTEFLCKECFESQASLPWWNNHRQKYNQSNQTGM